MVRNLIALLQRRPPAELDPGHVEALAEDVAQHTMLIVKASLDRFRGDSLLSTWVYRIAVNALLGDLRRRRWHQRSAHGELEMWTDDGADPDRAAAQRQLWTLVRTVIDGDLTTHQRTILLAQAFEAKPLDLIAADHGMSRDAVYKALHDARRKLRAGLIARGVSLHDVLEVFEGP